MKIRKSGVGIKITRTLQKQYSCYWWRRRGSLGALPCADTHADFPTVHRTLGILLRRTVLFDPLLKNNTNTAKAVFVLLVETKRIARRTAVRRHARGLSDRPPDARNSALQNRPVRSSSKKITRTPQKQYSCYWWRRRGSNSRPYGCEPYALPAELRPHWFAM